MKPVVVIPAYNESRYIAAVVSGVRDHVGCVVVVDDGSSDGTAAEAAGAGAVVLRRPHAGKGAALREGFAWALRNGFDWVLTIDGDGQHHAGDMPAFLDAASSGRFDMIVGSRMGDTSRMPFVRLVTNRVMSFVIRRLTGLDLADSQCGFRAVSATVLAAVTLETSNYDTESELIIKAARRGFSIGSVPVRTIYNGSRSYINKMRDTARFVRLVWRSLGGG
ncbi:MAG TPA: glycosyltransferase family 2 protein [Deltaproteobacteria bacterium]|nr:glycosyltransferase family 2 protein [Deltaproteobacteria bacterium]